MVLKRFFFLNLVFKFEEILADKTKEITKLVEFLEIKDANIAEIVKNVCSFQF